LYWFAGFVALPAFYELYIGWRISPNPLEEAQKNANGAPDGRIPL
jgi:hypothetical protein